MNPKIVGPFAIHVLTASGVAFALLALILATGGHWAMMFVCLGLALVVDGIDGPLARVFRVKERLPRWDGAGLDFVVDFTTYVFVPAYAIAASGYLPDGFGVPAAILIVVTGALYFADRTMKTDDNYFRGFPAVWNLVAFYLYILPPMPWIAFIVILLLCAATFAPIVFVHPLRVRRLRSLNIGLLALWAVLAALTIVANLAPGPVVVGALSAITLYFLAAGLLRRAG
ncbi:MAG: phosphatidylcholine synthase [Proteobacteria bacterium]|nr:phosphatidylcholine synthase [Pseudomonadota bacterium]